MDTIEAIMTRRSIRKFTDKPVSKEQVKTLLEAGMMAPTSRNHQPWYFVVIDNGELLDKIPEFHQYAQMVREAFFAILVCGDKSREKELAYIIQNCSAATQNILLAAHAMGLGAVWLGIYPREPRIKGITSLVGLPTHVLPVSLIAVGFPDEKKTSENRYDEANIRYNKWNE